jgi:hypothetical protein
MKYVQDAVADWLIPGLAKGQADSSPLIEWDYQQKPKGKGSQGFVIEIYAVDRQVA